METSKNSKLGSVVVEAATMKALRAIVVEKEWVIVLILVVVQTRGIRGSLEGKEVFGISISSAEEDGCQLRRESERSHRD